MRKVESLLGQYGESHQTKLNKQIHYFCVPAIFFSLIGLLSLIPVGGLLQSILPASLASFAHLGTVVILIGIIYYLRLSIPLFFGMLIFSILVLLGINQLQLIQGVPFWSIMVGIFVIAWVVQFYGHNHEGKKPEFLEDIQFLMVGPAWTISHIFDILNIKY